MPTSVDDRWAIDTSVAVPALDAAHAAHEVCRRAARKHRPALSGHAAFETYSVLTRLHGPLSIGTATASAALAIAFPDTCWLSPKDCARLLARMGPLGVSGGMVYDALVAEAALRAGRRLLTRDARAMRTYDLIGVSYLLVD